MNKHIQINGNKAKLALSNQDLVDVFQIMVENNHATVSESYPELAEILNPLIENDKWEEAFNVYKNFVLAQQEYPLINSENKNCYGLTDKDFIEALTEWAHEKFSISYPIPQRESSDNIDLLFTTEYGFDTDWIEAWDKRNFHKELWERCLLDRYLDKDSQEVETVTDEVWEFDGQGGYFNTTNLDYLLFKQGFVDLQKVFTITTTIDHKKRTASAKIEYFVDYWNLD